MKACISKLKQRGQVHKLHRVVMIEFSFTICNHFHQTQRKLIIKFSVSLSRRCIILVHQNCILLGTNCRTNRVVHFHLQVVEYLCQSSDNTRCFQCRKQNLLLNFYTPKSSTKRQQMHYHIHLLDCNMFSQGPPTNHFGTDS